MGHSASSSASTFATDNSSPSSSSSVSSSSSTSSSSSFSSSSLSSPALSLSESDFPPSPESDGDGALSSEPIFSFRFSREAYLRLYSFALAKSNYPATNQIERDTLQTYSNILSQNASPPPLIGTVQSSPSSSSHSFPSTSAAFLAGQRSLAAQVNAVLAEAARAAESERSVLEQKYREREKERESVMSMEAEKIAQKLTILKTPRKLTEEPCTQENEIVRKCYDTAQNKMKDKYATSSADYEYALNVLECENAVEMYHQCIQKITTANRKTKL